MPNIFAQLVFYFWPLLVYVLFRKLPLVPALVWSMMLAYLFLPRGVGIDLPLVPTIGKSELAPICAAVMCWLALRANKEEARKKAIAAGLPPITAKKDAPHRRSMARWVCGVLFFLAIVSPAFTAFTNSDPIFVGPIVLPGLRPYDALSMLAGGTSLILPFWLGRRFLDTPESHVIILKVFCFALMGYSLLALWEVRMSPQLNRQFYGFLSSAFLQHIRAGGFRPMVFLGHGLLVGILLTMSIIAAAALWRQTKGHIEKSTLWIVCVGWLLFTLVLAKSVGALVIALAMLPVVLLTRVRTQLLVCGVLAGVVLLYPMLRGAGYIPTEEILAFTVERSPERAQSLEFRIVNEEVLLEKASERPWLGWGTWGRNMVFDETTGRSQTVTDGIWIIIIGSFGWIGYIAQFGLLTAPLIFLVLGGRKLNISYATAGVAMVLTANLVDMLPNAALNPISWLLTGALVGRYIAASEEIRKPQGKEADMSASPELVTAAAPALKVRRRRSFDLTKETAPEGARTPVSGQDGHKRRVRR